MNFYICDRKACGKECPNPECSHTVDIEHAKNFEGNEDTGYWEVEKTDDRP